MLNGYVWGYKSAPLQYCTETYTQQMLNLVVFVLFLVLHCPSWEIQVALLRFPMRDSEVRHSNQKSSTSHSDQCVQYFRGSKL